MHIDAPSVGKFIGMFSLLSTTVMSLRHPANRTTASLLLDPNSLLLLRAEARESYEHGIPLGKTVQFGNKTFEKKKRYSIVFWKIADAQIIQNRKNVLSASTISSTRPSAPDEPNINLPFGFQADFLRKK
jgi:hypothetical protein